MGLLNQRLGLEESSPKSHKKENILYTTNEPSLEDSIKEQPVESITELEDSDDDIISVLRTNKAKADKIKKSKENPRGNNPHIKPAEELMVKEETEEEFELSSLQQIREERRQVEAHKKRMKIFNIIMISACIYVIFLIYGVFCTNYQYNDKGEIAPVTLNVKEIKALKDYNVMLGQYEKCRVLYEKVLQLDYRLGLGVEDPLTLAPEYENLLDEVNDLTVKTDALDVDTRYDTIKSMLLNWVKTDTAIYLQKISSGISQNNAEDASTAITYKTVMYDDFALISQNMITIGESVNGANVNSIKEWSPETYINEFINGDAALEPKKDGED